MCIRDRLDDVETFEVDPHGMGGVREPAVSESVSGKKIAELVVEARLGNAEEGDECEANCDNAETHEDHGEVPAPGQAGTCALQGMKSRSLETRGAASRREKNQPCLLYTSRCV